MKIHLLLPVIAAIIFPSAGLAEVGDPTPPQAVIAGEVENPGRFDLAKASTLGEIFSIITKPLAMGDTKRISVYHDGTRRDDE